MKGFTNKWEVFVKCIEGREKLPNWSRLGMILLKRIFEKGLWIVNSMKRWRINWNLKQNLTRITKTSVRLDVTSVVTWEIMPQSVMRRIL